MASQAANDCRGHDPFRPDEAGESERSYCEIAEAYLAHDGECALILDVKDRLRGELRAETLYHAGYEQSRKRPRR